MIKRFFLKSIILVCLFLMPCAATLAASRDTIVYITASGEKYHRGSCGSLWNSSIPITLEEAFRKRYSPCRKCNPPTLDESEKNIIRSNIEKERKKREAVALSVMIGPTLLGGLVVLLALKHNEVQEQRKVNNDGTEQNTIIPSQVKIKSTSLQADKTRCPQCGGKLVRRYGKYGYFYGCSSYPRCRYTRKYL